MGEVAEARLPRPVLYADLPGLLFLRLSAGLHHRPLPRLRDRDVRRDRSARHAGRDRHHDDLGARGGGDFGHRPCQHRGHAGCRVARASTTRRSICWRPIYTGRTIVSVAVHPDADDPGDGAAVLAHDGGALACHGAADLGPGRAYLRRCATWARSTASCSSATSSARSWASGWAGGFTTSTGNYTLVWWIGVGIGAFSALVHLPIRERPMQAVTA